MTEIQQTQLEFWVELKKSKPIYEQPSIDMTVLDEFPMICVSGDVSNGDYSEIIIDWGDEQ